MWKESIKKLSKALIIEGQAEGRPTLEGAERKKKRSNGGKGAGSAQRKKRVNADPRKNTKGEKDRYVRKLMSVAELQPSPPDPVWNVGSSQRGKQKTRERIEKRGAVRVEKKGEQTWREGPGKRIRVDQEHPSPDATRARGKQT